MRIKLVEEQNGQTGNGPAVAQRLDDGRAHVGGPQRYGTANVSEMKDWQTDA